MVISTVTSAPRRWWSRQSLRRRLTLLATALFTLAVATGAVLLLVLQRYALTRVLDQSAGKTARDISQQVMSGRLPPTVAPTTGGIAAVQVVDARNAVLAASQGTDHARPILASREQLREVRHGARIEIDSPTSDARLRVLGRAVGSRTVLVFTDVTRVDDSLRILTRAALIGGPLAVLVMALATYLVVALTLRSVAALRHGAADITAAGLAEQRLPVPGSQDEIHRLAVTLNAMLDRIDSATSRQRTFVGDAAHELRSPLASIRVQLEVGQRIGQPDDGWDALVTDVLVDVDRLDRLVEDLLALARLDESAGVRRQSVPLNQVVAAVVDGVHPEGVTVRAEAEPALTDGDPDALRRVVVNLVNNALRYARSEVVVRVAVEPVAPSQAARDRNAADRNASDRGAAARQCVLTVEDDGPGIAEDERERVFDRFYRVQESRSRDTGGTGLGLPIVRDIVRGHGGRVWLTDREDGQPGLRAVVVLPAAPDTL
ncbi:sensor histidine kinase [uncultured Jatrophihabitans sp.]|uniref:sensor histidine kinase n=1 Tax=uncultured Jatrophihabitans sp. TaxID=1610747 RepID=UPI0035CB837C